MVHLAHFGNVPIQIILKQNLHPPSWIGANLLQIWKSQNFFVFYALKHKVSHNMGIFIVLTYPQQPLFEGVGGRNPQLWKKYFRLPNLSTT